MPKFFSYTATGRYYKVYRDGQLISKHFQEREAIERSNELKFDFPDSEVFYTHDYEVNVGLTDAGITEARTYTPIADQPPTITSTPAPVFEEGTPLTYAMAQHVSDDGLSALTYSLSNVLPNGLSLNASTGVLSYDGVGAASASQHALTVTDAVGNDTSSSFTIDIQDVDNNISWTAPTTLGDGTPIGSQVTGYKVYQKSGGNYALYKTVGAGTVTTTVPDGTYAIAATWDNGTFTSQTGLSRSITVPHPASNIAGATQIFTTADDQTTIQTAISNASPGDLFLFRGGTYRFSWESSHSTTRLLFDAVGTSADPIVYASYPGEWAIFQGWGDQTKWNTAQTNAWAWPDNDTQVTQVLWGISGQYNHFYNMTVQYSSRHNIAIYGANNRLENCRSLAGWDNNLAVGLYTGASGSVENTYLKFFESAYCGVGSGITVTHESSPATSDALNYDGITMDGCVVYGNGRNADDRRVFGQERATQEGYKAGGNSDGIAVYKALNRNGSGGGALTNSLVNNLTLSQCFIFGNSDNQTDVCPGDNIVISQCVSGNIKDTSGDPGLNQGAWAFKWFLASQGSIKLLSNLAWSCNGPLGEAGPGFALIAETGVSDVKIINNSAIEMAQQGIELVSDGGVQSPNVTDSRIINHVNYQIENIEIKYYPGTESSWTTLNHWSGQTSGDPQLVDYDYAVSWPDALNPSGEPIDRWHTSFHEVQSKFMPISASSLIDGGVKDATHPTNPWDDPTSPADPEDASISPWFEKQVSATPSTVPDQGAVQYQYILPPKVS